MKKTAITAILLTFILSGCYIPPNKPKVNVYKQVDTLVVVSKRIQHIESGILSSSRDIYLIAFDNGDYERVYFGEYSIVEIGDTVTRSKLNTEWIWNYDLNYKAMK